MAPPNGRSRPCSAKKNLLCCLFRSNVLNTHGELSLAQLKKLVEAKGPIFEWAIGWLAREGKVVLTPKKRSFSIRLK